MAQGLLKGLAAGIAVSVGLIVVSSQTLDVTTVTLAPSGADDPVQTGPLDDGATDGAQQGLAQDTDADTQDLADGVADPEPVQKPALDVAASGQNSASDTARAAAGETAPVAGDASVEDGSGDMADTEQTADTKTPTATVEIPDTAERQAPEAVSDPQAPVVPETTERTDDPEDTALAATAEPAPDAELSTRIDTLATIALDDGSSPDVTATVDRPDVPEDGAAPSRPAGLDQTPTVADGMAPIAPVADTAPGLVQSAPPVETAASPSLDQPVTDSADTATAAPDSDAPILPVPESLPPDAPAPDTAPVATDAPQRASAVPTVGSGATVPVGDPPALIDGDIVTARAALETSIRSGDRPADAVDTLREATGQPENRAPDPTGRDRVRVNRLAQITPPEAEAEAETDPEAQGDGTAEADGEDETATSEAEAAPSVPPEDVLLSEDALASDDDATDTQETAPSRPSSNLIERRIRAATAQSGDSTGQAAADESPAGDAPATRRTAALAPRDTSSASSGAPETDDPKAAPEQATPLTGIAMEDYAQPFENPTGLPLVSVVLLDYGGPLIDLPLPLSVALDARQPKVAARAAAYRAQGYEVLVIPSLPKGATAQDIEQSLQASLAAVDGAVAVLPDPTSDVQANRAAIETIVGRLGETGLGLVSFPQGLNRAPQIAARENVPAGLVFRQVDGDGQDLRAVKRFLDQAAFRARQEDAVILVGRNRPETRGALMEWRLGNRAESVQLAPVTAAIRALSP